MDRFSETDPGEGLRNMRAAQAVYDGYGEAETLEALEVFTPDEPICFERYQVFLKGTSVREALSLAFEHERTCKACNPVNRPAMRESGRGSGERRAA